MKPYGQGGKVRYFESKQDHHIHRDGRKVGNWWEGERKITKARSRQAGKLLVKRELEEELSEKNINMNKREKK